MSKRTGEQKFSSGGVDYCMKGSFRTLDALEEDIDLCLRDLSIQLGELRLRTRHLKLLFWHSLKAGGHDITLEDVDPIFDDIGLTRAMIMGANVIQWAFGVEDDTSGKKPKKAKGST